MKYSNLVAQVQPTMKNLKHGWNRTSNRLKIAFWASIIIVIIYEVVLNQIIAPSEWFYRVGRIGVVLIQILYSFITGFVFYFSLQFIDQDKKKVALFRLINNKIIYIALGTDNLMREICRVGNAQENESLDFKKFSDLCRTIHTHDVSFKTSTLNEKCYVTSMWSCFALI